MSITPRNIQPNSIILNTQNRTEFLDKFRQQTINKDNNRNQSTNPNTNPNEGIYQGRWDYLHDLNKLKLIKIDEQRQKVQHEREESMYSECTFTPKLNKSATYNHISQIEGGGHLGTEGGDQYYNLLGRQEAWNLKKHLKIEELKQKKNISDVDQCYFRPEVNPPNALGKYQLKTSATKLVEDPESYTMFIARITNKRKADEEKKERQRTLPGSGNIWSAKPKSYNLSYDYTKHEHSSRSIPRAGSTKEIRRRVIGNNKGSKQISLTRVNYDNSCSNDQQLSSMKEKYNDYLYRENRGQGNGSRSKEKMINNVSNQFEYDKAIEYLHNELYSFPLLKDEGSL